MNVTGQPYAYAGGDPVNATDPTGLGPIVNPDAPLGLSPTDFLPPGNEGWLTYQPSASTLREAAALESQAQSEALDLQRQAQQELVLIQLRTPNFQNALVYGLAKPVGPSAAQLCVAAQLDAFWSQQATAAFNQWALTEGIPYDDGLTKPGIIGILDEIGLRLLEESIG